MIEAPSCVQHIIDACNVKPAGRRMKEEESIGSDDVNARQDSRGLGVSALRVTRLLLENE